MSVTNTHDFGSFWGPRAIFTTDDPQGALTCRSSTLTVWPILARFMDYYSLFWGPEVMTTSDEPCGAFTCRSWTLTILADSGPIRGLLVTILGPRAVEKNREKVLG